MFVGDVIDPFAPPAPTFAAAYRTHFSAANALEILPLRDFVALASTAIGADSSTGRPRYMKFGVWRSLIFSARADGTPAWVRRWMRF